MTDIHIGWPEGLVLAILFILLINIARNHGEERDGTYNFPLALTFFGLWLTLLGLGGFFS